MKNSKKFITSCMGESECGFCMGDEPLYWKDEKNNAFIDSKGEILATISGKEMRFPVNCCPNCGRKFEK